jgi:TonB family protein
LWAAFLGASVAVNLSAALLVSEIGFSGSVVHRGMLYQEPETDPVSLVNYSCQLDAALASSAHMLGCATPIAGDREACARRAVADQQLAFLQCIRPPEPVTVAMIDLDKIKPLPILPIAPVDDIVAAQLLEQEVVKQIEEAQKQVQQRRPPVAGQVVEITQPQLQSQPDRARFLSEYDSQVKKETVARGSTEEMVDRPSPRELPVTEKPPPELPEELTAERKPDEATAETSDNATDNPGAKGDGSDKPSLLAMRGVGQADRRPSEAREAGELAGKTEISSEGIERRRGDGERRSEKSELEPEGGGGGDGGDTKRTPDLKPSKETLARAVGGGSVDKLDNVESGDYTALNSRKWKYASFFNRLKRRVAQNWHPDKVYLRRDPTGKVYGTKDRITVLRVSLKPNGSLAKVYVAKQSGVDFLDDEAVRAFREAGPFPNPPQALVEDGLITFSFGFHFQIGGRPDSWRIFRYR